MLPTTTTLAVSYVATFHRYLGSGKMEKWQRELTANRFGAFSQYNLNHLPFFLLPAAEKN